MTATQEFVVPRSIPISLPTLNLAWSSSGLLLLSCRLLLRRLAVVVGGLALGNLHQRGPKQPVAIRVTLAEGLGYRSLGQPGHRFVAQRLVHRRIEEPAGGVLGLYAVAIEHGEQLTE